MRYTVISRGLFCFNNFYFASYIKIPSINDAFSGQVRDAVVVKSEQAISADHLRKSLLQSPDPPGKTVHGVLRLINGERNLPMGLVFELLKHNHANPLVTQLIWQVYARHGRDLKGESPLWRRYLFVRSNIAKGKPLVQGKGGFARKTV